MKSRPKSITIISFFLIIINLIAITSTTLSYDNPEVIKVMELSSMPLILQYIFMILGHLITLLSAVLMLKAKKRGRTMYVGWSIISLIIGLSTAPAKALMIPSLVFFLIVTLFLFRRKANEFFSNGHERLIYDS
ncbi:hypothetical protein UB33_00365 [Photobacterium angustum]|uniref:hypothetical protein n=1 Tax=Photobacterium angustum TaxID=661 RepID=UPI0005E68D13|nr:hypothetical protein [Photobacterium angustum]KJF96253.1 hypothetical protein UB39_02715 [Photobacterium angustum]KJG08064.1 hypothetical protein UB33_00365 [Photobacterium angustum]PSV88156.1 hypothetical protein CTN01_20525 [Photobacterium angustum]PSW82297.1 hypothetical protein CTN03_03770 [Photobacterium angustum]